MASPLGKLLGNGSRGCSLPNSGVLYQGNQGCESKQAWVRGLPVAVIDDYGDQHQAEYRPIDDSVPARQRIDDILAATGAAHFLKRQE